MALQHAGEAVAHFRGRLADRHRAGDVGGAVQILRAGIDQIEAAVLQHALGGGRAPGNGRWRRSAPRPRWWGKLRPLKCSPVAAESLERVGNRDLLEPALEAPRRKPGEEPGQRRAVAPVGVAAAFQLHRILARLGQKTGIGRADDGRAGFGQAVENPGGATRRIGQHALLAPRPAGREPRRAHRAGRCARRCRDALSSPPDTLRRSMNRSTEASACRIAKHSATGV